MKIASFLWLLASWAAMAQSPPKASFPCRMADYRVVSETEIRVRCGVPATQDLHYRVQISELNAKSQPVGALQNVSFDLLMNVEKQWAKVALSTPLKPETNYRLSTLAAYRVGNADVAFDTEDFDFNTKGEVTIILPSGDSPNAVRDKDGRVRFVLFSKMEVDATSLSKGSISEDLTPLSRPLDASFKSYQESYPKDTPASDQIGIAFIWVAPPGVKSLDTHLTLKGVQDIFKKDLTVPAKQRLKLAGAPKDKASSDFYAQILSQAGPGAKPGWVTDVKFSPQLANLGHGIFFSPLALANLGFGTGVQGVKTTDMIQLGAGVTKLFLLSPGGEFQAVQIAPHVDFETDRMGHHQNILFDGDSQWFGKGWLRSIKDKNAQIYAEAAYPAVRNGQKPPDPDTLKQATWGFQLLTLVGTEIGGQLSTETVKSSDKKTSVTVPTYNIARLRPKVALTYEYKQLSLTATIIPRYLFAAESVTRETKVPDPRNASNQIAQIYLSKTQGLRAYGEAGISWQFDPAGHYALTVNYKLGSLPPNFDYVNTVQSGITVKF